MKHLINLVITLFVLFACFPVYAARSVDTTKATYNIEPSADVLAEFNKIIQGLPSKRYRQCDIKRVKKVTWKVLENRTAIGIEYKRLARKHKWKVRAPTATKLHHSANRFGFATMNPKTKHHRLYVTPLDSDSGYNVAKTWAHELAHAYCGEWHAGEH